MRIHGISKQALRVAGLTAALLTSPVCMAAGWTPDLTVSGAFTEDSDIVVIYTSGGGTYTSGCAANAWIFTTTTDQRRARAYATVLTALAAGKSVRLWFTDSCASWGYHEAKAVQIVN